MLFSNVLINVAKVTPQPGEAWIFQILIAQTYHRISLSLDVTGTSGHMFCKTASVNLMKRSGK